MATIEWVGHIERILRQGTAHIMLNGWSFLVETTYLRLIPRAALTAGSSIPGFGDRITGKKVYSTRTEVDLFDFGGKEDGRILPGSAPSCLLRLSILSCETLAAVLA